MKKNIYNLIEAISCKLAHLGLDRSSAEQEAFWLLEKLTGKKQVELLAEQDIAFSQDQEQLLTEWLTQRVRDKKPLQYILGEVPFVNLSISVEPPILIPRPETEEMTVWLLNKLKPYKEQALKVLDLCCGTGCIGLTVAKNFPLFSIVGVDINPKAVALSEKNQQLNHITNATFGISNLFNSLKDERFDLIVCNPPYISEKEYQALPEQVTEWEDYRALVAGPEGTEMYQTILHSCKKFLRNGDGYPQLVFEIGWQQQEVEQMIHDVGFSNVELFYDLEEKPRWVAATL